MKLQLIAVQMTGKQLDKLKLVDISNVARENSGVASKTTLRSEWFTPEAVVDMLINKHIDIVGVGIEELRLAGTNGAFTRYAELTNIDPAKKYPLTIFERVNANGVDGYTVFDVNARVLTVTSDMLVKYAEAFGVANGKVVEQNGKKYISAIRGEYSYVGIRPTYEKVETTSDEVQDIQLMHGIKRGDSSIPGYWPEGALLKDENLNLTAEEKLVICYKAIQGWNFFIYGLLASLKQVPVKPQVLKTCAVDIDLNLYYCPQFVIDLPLEQLTFVLLHEVYHVLFSHPARDAQIQLELKKNGTRLGIPKHYLHNMYNIAADMFVNKFIAEQFDSSVARIRDYPHVVVKTDPFVTRKANATFLKGLRAVQLAQGGIDKDEVDINRDTVEILYKALIKQYLKQQEEERRKQEEERRKQEEQQQQQQEEDADCDFNNNSESSDSAGNSPDTSDEQTSNEAESTESEGGSDASDNKGGRNEEQESEENESANSSNAGNNEESEESDTSSGNTTESDDEGTDNEGSTAEDNEGTTGNKGQSDMQGDDRGEQNDSAGEQRDSSGMQGEDSAEESGADSTSGGMNASGQSTDDTTTDVDQELVEQSLRQQFDERIEKIAETLDDLFEQAEENSDLFEGQDYTDENGEKRERTPEEIAELTQKLKNWREKLKNSVLKAEAASRSKGYGLSAAERRLIEQIIKPVPIDWRTILKNMFNMSVKKVQSYKRPSRRPEVGKNVVMPGYAKNADEGLRKFLICVDTSGSVSDELLIMCLGAIKKLTLTYKVDVDVVWWSDDIDGICSIKRDADLVRAYKSVASTGGTNIDAVFEAVASPRGPWHGKNIEGLIFFTDGCVGTIDPKYKRLAKYCLWLIHSGNTSFTPPFGKTVYIDNEGHTIATK